MATTLLVDCLMTSCLTNAWFLVGGLTTRDIKYLITYKLYLEPNCYQTLHNLHPWCTSKKVYFATCPRWLNFLFATILLQTTLLVTLDKLQNELFLLAMINTYLMLRNFKKLNFLLLFPVEFEPTTSRK
jgi:hypothetical protein